jgi:hypothetical protein
MCTVTATSASIKEKRVLRNHILLKIKMILGALEIFLLFSHGPVNNCAALKY